MSEYVFGAYGRLMTTTCSVWPLSQSQWGYEK